jgi:hypothetical protein
MPRVAGLAELNAHLCRCCLILQPGRGQAAVPGVCRALRAAEPADYQQPAVRQVGPGIPGRTDDRGAARRLPHKCHIFEMNGESYRFRESMKPKKDKDAKKAK